MLQAQYWARFAILQGMGLKISIQEIIPDRAGYKNNGDLSWITFKIKGQPNFDYEFDGYILRIHNEELKRDYEIIVRGN